MILLALGPCQAGIFGSAMSPCYHPLTAAASRRNDVVKAEKEKRRSEASFVRSRTHCRVVILPWAHESLQHRSIFLLDRARSGGDEPKEHHRNSTGTVGKEKVDSNI
jgi:hypothetical protein